MTKLKLLSSALALSIVTGPAVSKAAPFQDALVQAPSLAEPKRGSIAGSLSRLSLGAGDLARGAYALPLAIEAPSERGQLLAQIFPSYSTEAGISEWGMGFSADLAIRRHRVLGEPEYNASDEFSSPWGRLVKGDDGFYPAGLRSMVRVREANGGFEAVDAAGTKYTFAASDAVANPLGKYAWMLSKVESLLGDVTYLRWQRNASGRAFLDSATWGGRADGTQYEAKLVYEALPAPFVSYATFSKQLLDQRVSRIVIKAKRDGQLTERYSYLLSYTTSPLGPAFYLTGLTKRFASGAQEPSHVFSYDFNDERFRTAQLVHQPALDTIIADRDGDGSATLQPEKSVALDFEQNGLTDLERAKDNALIRRTESGFVVEKLPARTGTENPLCRLNASSLNRPRFLARLRGSDGEPQVFVSKLATDRANTTVLTSCTRAGHTISNVPVSGNWELGANVRLADVDSDRKPDLIRVYRGGVQVLRNVSDPNREAFEVEAAQTLGGNLLPISTWILDVNGDGKSDIMARASNGVMVWYGTGKRKFDPTPKSLRFKTLAGTFISDISKLELSHGDYNGDGLSDVILSCSREPGACVRQANVFLNQGDTFAQKAVPNVQNIPFTFGYPLVADLSGSGNEEVLFTDATRAMVLGLTAPSTGLLRKLDDGKGTTVEFEYARSKPGTSNASRPAVTSGLTISSTGYGSVTQRFEYDAPAMHSKARFLLGFGSVTKTHDVGSEVVTFHNDDDVSGLPVDKVEKDNRTPGLERFTSDGFELASYKGLPFRRRAESVSGYRSPDGSAALTKRVAFEEYARPLCVSQTRTEQLSGILVRFDGYASVAGLDDDLHCTSATQRMIGLHADTSLNFDYSARIDRNSRGQATRIVQTGPDGEFVLQDNTYTANFRLETSGAPGRGVQQFGYDNLGRLKHAIAADGSVARVAAMDPLTDALKAFERDRGGLTPAAFYYAFDGFDRMQKSWDSFTGSSLTSPGQTLSYQFATAAVPALISSTTLVDAQRRVQRSGVDLLAADGEALGRASWNGLWHFSNLRHQDRANGIGTVRHRSPLAGSNALSALTVEQLYASADVLDHKQMATFGHVSAQTSTLQQSVSRRQSRSVALFDGELVERVVENDSYVKEAGRDAEGHVLWQRDESGVEHSYTYDALGRLVAVRTPDGVHRLCFDAYGRPARVERQNVGAIEYTYHARSGLLEHKRFYDAAGALERTERTDYDELGRAVHTEHVRTSDVAVRDYWLDYDGLGAGAGGTTLPGQVGLLSRVQSDKYERRMQYDVASRVSQTNVKFGNGWRDLEISPRYRADGSTGGRRLRVRDAAGNVRIETDERTELDAFGRLEKSFINERLLYTLSYDGEGRVKKATFADGHVITPSYDSVTRRRRGYDISGPRINASMSFDLDERGQTVRESYSAGKQRQQLEHSYDPRGLLLESGGGKSFDQYLYTDSGLPRWASDGQGERVTLRGASSMDVGGTNYEFDTLGRVVSKGEWSYEYGPSGQLDVARKAQREVRYYYDERGQRVFKEVNGAPARAYIDRGVLTETALIQQIDIDGMLVGVLENSVFRPIATNQLGTAYLDDKSELELATAYGVRESRTSNAEAVDFARLGYDADLGVIRMGVRDYDPMLAQFWTADPLLLESLERCQKSPLEANLFAYARGNPLTFTDPTGTEAGKHGFGVKLGDWDLSIGGVDLSFGDFAFKKLDNAPKLGVTSVMPFGTLETFTYDWGFLSMFEWAHVEAEVFTWHMYDSKPNTDTFSFFGLKVDLHGPGAEGSISLLGTPGGELRALSLEVTGYGCFAWVCYSLAGELGLKMGLQGRGLEPEIPHMGDHQKGLGGELDVGPGSAGAAITVRNLPATYEGNAIPQGARGYGDAMRLFQWVEDWTRGD